MSRPPLAPLPLLSVLLMSLGPIAAAQDEVAVGIASGADDADLSISVDAKEAVWLPGGTDGIDGGGDTPIGSVLEAHGHG